MSAEVGNEQQLRMLIDAGVALTSELSLEQLLQKITDTAAALAGARYAALGVLDERHMGLERFVTTGIDEHTRSEIGDPPVGRGVLGRLIQDPRPVRLHDLSQDPRSVGFPPGHPPMRSFLGVPVCLRGILYGNLYLTEKLDGTDFTDVDEELVSTLADQAAVAIENARLWSASSRWIRKLEALAEVGNVIAGEVDLRRLLQLIVARIRDVVDSRLAVLMLAREDGVLYVEAADGDTADEALGMVSLPGHSKASGVFARQRSERIDSVLDDPEFDPSLIRALGSTAAIFAPMLLHDRAVGVIAVHDKQTPDRRFSETDQRLVELFAGKAAIAIDLSRRLERETLDAFLRAQELERARLARELHDETGQALTAILLGLRSVTAAGTKEELEAAADRVRALAVEALEDVRQLAFDLRPKALDDFGLAAALERLRETVALRSGLRIDVQGTPVGRLQPDVESAVYRMVQEALTNAVKHAEASSVSVVVSARSDGLVVVVEDDGCGFDPETAGDGRFGLVAMRERIAQLGGTLRIDAEPGAGTTLRALIPRRS